MNDLNELRCKHPNGKLVASYGPKDFLDGKSSVDVYACPDCGEEYDESVQEKQSPQEQK